MNKISIDSIRLSVITTIVFLLICAGKGHAQSKNLGDIGMLSLRQCINIAQDESAQADAARFALYSSRWQYQSYRADLFPSLNLSGNAPNYRKTISSYRLDDGSYAFQDTRQSEAEASLSIDQNILPTGGTLSLSSGINKLGIFSGENTYLWQSTPLVVGLDQPLFQFNRLKWRNRTEPLQLKIAQKEFGQTMEDIAGSVTNGFFNVYMAKINLQNAEFNVARNDSIYEISQGRYRIGSIAENDLLQSELALRNAQSALSTARIEYDRAQNDFKILLGYPTNVLFQLKEPKDLPVVEINIEKAKQLALKNNSESLTYRLNEIQAKQSVAQAKSEANFSANIQASYGLNQTSSEFNNLYENPQNRQFFTIGFDIPLFNWGKQRAQIEAARNQQQSVANNIQLQRRRFLQEIDYTVSQFLQLRRQALLKSQADTIAQRRYEVAQNRYVIGKISITDLFNAQRDKDAARQAYIQALRTFWSGYYNLRELTLYDFQDHHPITYEP